LSEQFPANDKWRSAGFHWFKVAESWVRRRKGDSPIVVASSTRRPKIQGADMKAVVSK